MEVGIRDLKSRLSEFVTRAAGGERIVVTDRGRPVARLSPLDHPLDRLADLVASGAVQPPKSATRYRPAQRIKAKGSVSDLVAQQRR